MASTNTNSLYVISAPDVAEYVAQFVLELRQGGLLVKLYDELEQGVSQVKDVELIPPALKKALTILNTTQVVDSVDLVLAFLTDGLLLDENRLVPLFFADESGKLLIFRSRRDIVIPQGGLHTPTYIDISLARHTPKSLAENFFSLSRVYFSSKSKSKKRN